MRITVISLSVVKRILCIDFCFARRKPKKRCVIRKNGLLTTNGRTAAWPSATKRG